MTKPVQNYLFTTVPFIFRTDNNGGGTDYFLNIKNSSGIALDPIIPCPIQKSRHFPEDKRGGGKGGGLEIHCHTVTKSETVQLKLLLPKTPQQYEVLMQGYLYSKIFHLRQLQFC
jgi:hypothetical protein